MAAAADSGSGPSFRPSGASASFTCATVTPGSTHTDRPPSRTARPFQARRKSATTPVPSVCPESEVPAARKVSGTPHVRTIESRFVISSIEDTRTTARGRY